MKVSNIVLPFVAVCLAASVALAASKDELKQRIRERQSTIRQLESQGKIGETYDGLVAGRSSLEAKEQKVVDAEISDRQELYQLLASEFKISPTQVAEQSGKRHFEEAGPNDWLKTKDGKWVQKKDLPRS